MKISVGQVWETRDERYLLCAVDYRQVALIRLDGLFENYTQGIPVEDMAKINQREWAEISGKKYGDVFKLLGDFDKVYGRKP